MLACPFPCAVAHPSSFSPPLLPSLFSSVCQHSSSLWVGGGACCNGCLLLVVFAAVWWLSLFSTDADAHSFLYNATDPESRVHIKADKTLEEVTQLCKDAFVSTVDTLESPGTSWLRAFGAGVVSAATCCGAVPQLTRLLGPNCRRGQPLFGCQRDATATTNLPAAHGVVPCAVRGFFWCRHSWCAGSSRACSMALTGTRSCARFPRCSFISALWSAPAPPCVPGPRAYMLRPTDGQRPRTRMCARHFPLPHAMQVRA